MARTRPPCRRRRFPCRAAVLVLALLLFIALLTACGTAEAPAAERPHIVLVLVDALRRDHVGAYGYSRPTTPFLDRLAAEGVVFDNAWAQASQTFNSTSTLLTSRHFPYLAASLGVAPIPGLAEGLRLRHAKVPRLAAANLTLPEVLRDAGYETLGLFTNPHHHPASGFWQGFTTARYLPRSADMAAYARGPKVHAALFDWLDQRQSDAPFFVYFHLMDVHAPYRPPLRLRKRFVTVKGRERYLNGIPEEGLTADDLAYMEALYDAEIRFVDGVIEALVEDLEERGLWHRTVLVVTSDHGDEFLDHGGLGHGMTLEPEQLRIPLIIAGPGVELIPARAGNLVRNLDLAPTLADLAGIEVSDFEGESLLPALRGESHDDRRTSFAWLGTLRSLSDADWHFATDLASGATTLYDLRRDSRGTTNLAEERPEVVEDLSAALRRFERRRVEAERFMADNPEEAAEALPAEIVDQLRALGYL